MYNVGSQWCPLQRGSTVQVLLNAHHLRRGCKCSVETVLHQRRSSDPEN